MVWNEEVEGKFVAALAWKDSRKTIYEPLKKQNLKIPSIIKLSLQMVA